MLLIVITFAHWVSVGDGNSGFFCVPGGIKMFCEYDSIYCLNNITSEIVLKTTIKGKL